MTSRISSGLLFVELNYLENNPTPDVAWIRNIYILLSFYTELLLKALYAYKKDYSSISELDDTFRKQGHNLEKIAQELGVEVLDYYGIKSIQKNTEGEYLIETDLGGFFVADFIDIRYDFMDERVRILNGNEHEMFRKQIKFLHRINGFLTGPAWS